MDTNISWLGTPCNYCSYSGRDLTFIISTNLVCLFKGSHLEPIIAHGSLLMTMMLTRLESDMAGHCWFDMADANTLVLALIEVMVKSLFGFKWQILFIIGRIHFEHERVQ